MDAAIDRLNAQVDALLQAGEKEGVEIVVLRFTRDDVQIAYRVQDRESLPDLLREAADTVSKHDARQLN